MVEIPFYANQKPSLAAFGEVSDTAIDPFGEKATYRTHHFLERTGQILNGERPIMGGNGDGDKWLKQQIQTMIDSGMLPEHIGAYVRQPAMNYVLGQNPVASLYIDDREELKDKLAAHEVPNTRVAGDRATLFKHFHGNDLESQVESANTTIAIPGEINAMREILHLIQQKLQGHMLDHPLIIENPVDGDGKGFWDQMLRGIKLMDFDQDAEPHEKRKYVDLEVLGGKYGIHISEDRATTLTMAKKFASTKTPVTKLSNEPFIPDGSVLFVATGTQKKYDEIAAICKAQGIQVDVRPIYELVGTYVGPVEDKRTYEGNVKVKVEAAFKAWHSMDEDKRTEALAHNGITKAQAFIIAEDSGFHFKQPGIVNHPVFRKIYSMLDPDAPFPGVETGPSTIGSDGIMGFMKKIEQVFADTRSPDYGVVKKSLIGIAPLVQHDYGATDMQIVSSEVHGTVTFKPQPSPNVSGAVEIDNYLIPNLPGRLKRTEAQLGDEFYLEHSPRAIAMRGLAREAGIPIDKSKPFEFKYSANFRAGLVVDDHSYSGKLAAEKLVQKADAQGFEVGLLPSKFESPDDIQKNALAHSDGIVFAFDPATAQDDFWRNVYLFTSVIVAEQTHDKYKLKKPFYLVNPEGAFDYLISMVSDFHYSGTVQENPNSLYKVTKTIEEAVEKLKHDRLEYRSFVLPPHATQEKPFRRTGRDGKKDFNVAIFCSATNKNDTNMAHARDTTNKLIDEDFGIVSGGGMLASMGEITSAAYARRQEGAEHMAANAVHIMPGEGDASQYVTQFQKSRDIYERMEYMIDKSDAFIIMPGGTGTLQELSLLALLKKRHLEMDDPYATEKMKHKEIYIVNSPMETQKRGFYQKLKEIIEHNDPESLKKLGIHFVNNEDEALAAIREQRLQKRTREGWVPAPANSNRAHPKVHLSSNGHSGHSLGH